MWFCGFLRRWPDQPQLPPSSELVLLEGRIPVWSVSKSNCLAGNAAAGHYFSKRKLPSLPPPPPPHTPYLLPKALVPGCAGQASAGRPGHPWGAIQLEQRPGSQRLRQGLELAQPLALQLPDRLGLAHALQLLSKCYWKRQKKVARGPL